MGQFYTATKEKSCVFLKCVEFSFVLFDGTDIN